MGTTASNKIIRVTAAAVTGLIALSAYAGAVGLLGGGISLGTPSMRDFPSAA